MNDFVMPQIMSQKGVIKYIIINGRKIDIPLIEFSAGDVIRIPYEYPESTVIYSFKVESAETNESI